MPKVEIKIEEADDSDFARVAVLIDGERVGGGTAGGEPEDNSLGRTYSWIEGTLEELAKGLGADVTIERKTLGPDDE